MSIVKNFIHWLKSIAAHFLSTHDFNEKTRKREDLTTQGASKVVSIPLPSKDLPIEILETEHELQFQAGYVKLFESAWLIGRHAAVIPDNLGLLPDSIGGTGYYPVDSLTWRDLLEIFKVKGNGKFDAEPEYDMAVTLVHRYSRGFYHWMTEAIPRLKSVEEFLKQNNVQPILIIPANSPSFIYESLSLMGYPLKNIREWDIEDCRVKHLIFSSFRDYYNWLPISVLEWMRDRFRNEVDLMQVGELPYFTRRIYISRQKAGRRRVLNEEELIDRLKEIGFTCLELEDLTLQQQIYIFQKAEFIIGPHGAGFTNMIWSNRARIFEIFGNQIIPCYYKLARSLGFPYTCVVAKAQGNDIIVKSGEILAAVDNFFGN